VLKIVVEPWIEAIVRAVLRMLRGDKASLCRFFIDNTMWLPGVVLGMAIPTWEEYMERTPNPLAGDRKGGDYN
jgi:hypothetical protein